MPTADVRIQLPERYRVVRHVANGGMASVWAAEDAVLGRLVAVKVLAQHVAADPSARKRFEREARTAAKVSDHPNVATIYDVGEHDAVPFIVMELFAGGSVADRLRGGRPVPHSRALAWLEQTAEALDYAHSADIVHRDVKPANLLLDDRDRLAVGDFGIARIADDSNLTQAGQVLGTAAYLSPEQAMGRPATPASDRYALGVVAFELLAGRRPFQGEHIAAQARQHVEDQVPESGLGPEVDEVLRRSMAKDPDARFPTAARFVEDLRAVVDRAGATEATRRIGYAPAPTPTPSAPAPAAVAAPAPPRRREAVPPPPASPAYTKSAGGSGGGNGWRLLGALAALAAVVAIVALIASGGGSGSEGGNSASDEPATTQQRQETTEAAPSGGAAEEEAPQAEETPAEPTPPAEEEQAAPDAEAESGPGPDSEAAENPSALDAQGFRLLQAGQAEQAVPILERAVGGFRAQGENADPTGYGYALFNLGTAYARTGRPDEAIPLYEERLRVSPNDRPGIVRKALKDARKAAGRG